MQAILWKSRQWIGVCSMYIVEESGSATCRSTVPESSDLEVCKDMQHIDLSHLYNSSINGHGACPCGARCLPQVGTTSIQNVPKAVQRRNARKGDEKRSKSLWHFDDTLMILFCKESRKVSLSQLVGTMDFIYMEKPENDTMTLLYRKNESMPRTWHTLNNTCLVTVK